MRTEGERATIDKVAIAIAEAQHGVRGTILHRAHVRTARGRRQPTSSSTRAWSTWQTFCVRRHRGRRRRPQFSSFVDDEASCTDDTESGAEFSDAESDASFLEAIPNPQFVEAMEDGGADGRPTEVPPPGASPASYTYAACVS